MTWLALLLAMLQPQVAFNLRINPPAVAVENLALADSVTAKPRHHYTRTATDTLVVADSVCQSLNSFGLRDSFILTDSVQVKP